MNITFVKSNIGTFLKKNTNYTGVLIYRELERVIVVKDSLCHNPYGPSNVSKKDRYLSFYELDGVIIYEMKLLQASNTYHKYTKEKE